ncbi:MAG: hypothetical protein FWD58_08190 [Firmicutes bacterium]|nr:hypothetical protein [Bacillota bacterium]
MKSEYKETFDGLAASEDAKQKAIDGLLRYALQAQAVNTEAKKERSPFKLKRIAVAVPTAAAILFCAIFIPLMTLNRETPSAQQSIEWGFTQSEVLANAEAAIDYYCGYKSEKNQFSINDVSLDFYYGYHAAVTVSMANVTAKACFVDGAGNVFNVKEIPDFFSEKYRCLSVFNEVSKSTEIEFSHSERLSVPKNAFVGEGGTIIFTLMLYTADGGVIGSGDVNAAELYYKVQGAKVTLSDTKKI